MTQPIKLVIAGGKTGGHLFPGIAVAQTVQQICSDAEIHFIGTDAPFETQTLSAYGYDHTPISAKPIQGKGMLDKAKAAAAVGISTAQALAALIRMRPDFVLGVGGFSSFSVVLAARILGIPNAIQEQNAFPGMTNRMLAKFTRAIFTGFEETRGFSQHPRTVFTGNPVRIAGPGQPLPSLDDTGANPLPDIDRDSVLPGAGDNDFILLVTGGSQGATSINQAMVQALPELAKLDGLYIVHQTGIRDEKEVQDAYKRHGIPSRVAAFFQEMPWIQDLAHLAVCRSGAGTVSELCLKGLPAILIPFPHAADDHQTWNARAMADQGAGHWIPDPELDAPALVDLIKNLKTNPDLLTQMADKARQMGMPQAALAIARHIIHTRKEIPETCEAQHVSN